MHTARILHVAICILRKKNRSMHNAIKKWKLQVQMSKPGQTHSKALLVSDVMYFLLAARILDCDSFRNYGSRYRKDRGIRNTRG